MFKSALFSFLFFFTMTCFGQKLTLSDMTIAASSLAKGQAILKAKGYRLSEVTQPDESSTSYLYKAADTYIVDIGISQFGNDVVITTRDKNYVNSLTEQAITKGFKLYDQGSLIKPDLIWYKYKLGTYKFLISNKNGLYKITLT